MQDILPLKNEEINNFQTDSSEFTTFNIDTKNDAKIYWKKNLYMYHNELSKFKNFYIISNIRNYRNINSYSR